MRRVRAPRELAYALIPALFGVQQLVEGGLWLTFTDEAQHLNASLTHIYQFFSHVLWPIYVPIAVWLIEIVQWRRSVLLAFIGAGLTVGLYQFYFLLTDPTVARISEGHVDYFSPHFYIDAVLTLYVLATCASPLFSSHSAVRWFGVAVTTSLAAASVFYWTWFISVWCFFAALISVLVLVHFRRTRASPYAAQTA